MPFSLTDLEKQAPSERLAESIHQAARHEEGPADITAAEATGAWLAASHAGFCVELAANSLTDAVVACHPALHGLASNLKAAVAELRDVLFVVGGHAGELRRRLAEQACSSQDCPACGGSGEDGHGGRCAEANCRGGQVPS